jgi:hypothetical protein
MIIRKVIYIFFPCYDNIINMNWILLTNITTHCVFFDQTQRLILFLFILKTTFITTWSHKSLSNGKEHQHVM